MIHRLSYVTKFARACIALAAGYALVLQVLLLSFTAANATLTPLQSDAFVICYGGGKTAGDTNPQPRHSPAGFADCTLSCTQGLSATAILPSDLSPVPVSNAGHRIGRDGKAAFILAARPSPKLAQGPPRIV